MRLATKDDVDYLAACFIKISRHMKAGETDAYISGLPNVVDDSIRTLASDYVNHTDAIALVSEEEGKLIGCLLGKITQSSFPPATIAPVGNISVCWVEPEYRKSQVAAQLVKQAEAWFKEKDIDMVELSYMAKNRLATTAWARLGYEPFRVFAYKRL